MKRASERTNSEIVKQGGERVNNPQPEIDMIAKGVATGVVATMIVQTGTGIVGTLARNPLVTFGLGVVTGYFTHKYRKEILAISNQATQQGKDFVLRQRQEFKNMLTASPETTEKSEELS